MKRFTWLIGALTMAATLTHFAPSAAQNPRCCAYRVIHHFRVCLPQDCQQPQVIWKWNTQAAAWQIGQTPVINQNNGTQTYNIPSSGTQCANAVYGQNCAFSSACASFNVNWITGTDCVQGQHSTYGRACVSCRRHGANSQASSYIVIGCNFGSQAQIQWAPQFSDTVGGECGVEISDPVYARLRDEAATEQVIELFDLRASGVNWQSQDDDGDGFPDSARIGRDRDRPKGHVTLLKNRPTGETSRIVIRYDNSIVSEAEATGEFAQIRLPQVGDPMPTMDNPIELPGSFNLEVTAPDGWVIEQIEMGGGGESGQPVPVQGDVNGDGCVDDADLLQVLFAFGGQGGAADVNGDGIVDDADLLIVLFNFGGGC
ncbi:MAG: dockerin type I domain-containing protein [Fimbriimonadales bacterium]